MKFPLHLALFGPSLVSTFWNSAANYHRGLLRAFAERGHRITFFEPDAPDREKHRDLPDPSWAEIVVYRHDSQWGTLGAVEQARGADVVIKMSAIGVYDELLEAEVLDLRSPATLVAFWDADAPTTLDRLGHRINDPFRALIPRYDLILTLGGGAPVVGAYAALGAKCCVPVYSAFAPADHFRTVPVEHFRSELSFLGNWLPDREARVDDFLFQTARLLPTRSFLLGGRGWENHPLPDNLRRVGHVPLAEHNAFNASANAVLNVTRAGPARYGFTPPARIFEAAAAGTCVISDSWPGIEMFFEPGREILVARDGAEVAEHLDQLTPDRAADIGDAARRRVLATHTYQHRVIELEAVFEHRSVSTPAAAEA